MSSKTLFKHWVDIAGGSKPKEKPMFGRKNVFQEMADALNTLDGISGASIRKKANGEFGELYDASGSKFKDFSDRVEVYFELAGFGKSDVTVSLFDKKRIDVNASRPGIKKQKSFNIYGDSVDLENISAELKDGLLTVTIPKKIESKNLVKNIPLK